MATLLRLQKNVFSRVLDCGKTASNSLKWMRYQGYVSKKEESRRRWIHCSSGTFGDIVPFKLADIGEGISEVQITEWYVNEGDSVKQFDPICEVKSDKASVTITSRFTGTIHKIHYEVDQEAAVGSALIDVEVERMKDTDQVTVEPEPILNQLSTTEILPPPPVPVKISPSSVGNKNGTKDGSQRQIILTTPSVRKIGKENNINLADVPATGKDGRVLKEDILNYLQQSKEGGRVQSVPLAEDRVEHIKGLKKAMVKSMDASLLIPHFGYCDEIEASELIRVRKELMDVCKERGIKLTYMPFFLKAASMALHDYPILNSSLDLQNMNIIFKSSHNIGVAMDTKDGLLVPNIKNVNTKSVFEISEDLVRLHELGLKGKLGLDDLTGGTFTLSNIGTIGGTYAKPVIAPPEVAIGALGRIQTVPRFNRNGDVIKANIFNVSWSADHRIIDGATMARFSNLWKSYLENPVKMILELK